MRSGARASTSHWCTASTRPDCWATVGSLAAAAPLAGHTLVRAGIAVYGLHPSAEVQLPEDFMPALAWKTQVAQVKTLPPGSFVGYGATYCTPGARRIAVIPVGYADGFRRAPQNWGEVLVRGSRAPIVGRVTMDQTMIDVTHIAGVRQGDEVVLIGAQGTDRITAEEVAARLGTINYEVVSAILARVPRRRRLRTARCVQTRPFSRTLPRAMEAKTPRKQSTENTEKAMRTLCRNWGWTSGVTGTGPMITEKSRSVSPRLNIWPTVRIVARIAEATPYSRRSAEPMIAFMLGEEKSPNPTPTSSRLATM